MEHIFIHRFQGWGLECTLPNTNLPTRKETARRPSQKETYLPTPVIQVLLLLLVSARISPFQRIHVWLAFGCQYHAWTWWAVSGLNEGVSSMPIWSMSTDSYLFKLHALNPYTKNVTLPETNIAMENPPFWWYLPGKMVIFMGYVSFREGTWDCPTFQDSASPNWPQLWIFLLLNDQLYRTWQFTLNVFFCGHPQHYLRRELFPKSWWQAMMGG